MSEKYAFIEAEDATMAAEAARAPTITQMCAWLRVSRSGFYEWRVPGRSPRPRKEEAS